MSDAELLPSYPPPHRKPPRHEAVPTGTRSTTSSVKIRELGHLINGCKDDLDGMNAKITLVKSFIAATEADLLDVVCWLHLFGCVTVDGRALLNATAWQHSPRVKPRAYNGPDDHPGMFVASALKTCADPSEMAGVVEQFLNSNVADKTSLVDLLRLLNARGFVHVESSRLQAAMSWKKPGAEAVPAWRRIWTAGRERRPLDWDGRLLPSGTPTYIDAHDIQGRRLHLVFLGSIDESSPGSAIFTPQQVLCDHFRLPLPCACFCCDAGSSHPQQFDSTHLMSHLPQLHGILHAAADLGGAGAAAAPPPGKGQGGKERRRSTPPMISLRELTAKSIATWQSDLTAADHQGSTSTSFADSIIHENTVTAFCAMLKAVALSGSWLIIDRTDGQGSPSAELLLEEALARNARRPTIIAVDSLERLGKARDGRRAHAVLNQLCDMFQLHSAKQRLGHIQKEPMLDFLYTLEEFSSCSRFEQVADGALPFEALPAHMDATGDQCERRHKWQYFYRDGLFASATHYILKNYDQDEFDLDFLAQRVLVCAHGGADTCRRVRACIQQGSPVVLMQNTGGATTAFGWLHHVMATSRPVPEYEQIRTPLAFLLSTLSRESWIDDFGSQEVSILRSFAERAPVLFPEHVASVDILSASERDVIDAIRGCFMVGPVVLDHGVEETNITFSAWKLHRQLCRDAHAHLRKANIAQRAIWVLAFLTLLTACGATSLDMRYYEPSPAYARYPQMPKGLVVEVIDYLRYATLALAAASALVTLIAAKMSLLDKYSASMMAATSLVSEIYKFRTGSLEYYLCAGEARDVLADDKGSQASSSTLQPSSAIRQLFVDRVQASYEASSTGASKSPPRPTRGRIDAPTEPSPRISRQSTRSDVRSSVSDRKPKATEEERVCLGLGEWIEVKEHVEQHQYNTSWAIPLGTFRKWYSGLQPLLSHRSLRNEMKSTVEALLESGKLKVFRAKPLGAPELKLVRRGLASKFGLGKGKNILDAHKDEIALLQRQVMLELPSLQPEPRVQIVENTPTKEDAENPEMLAIAPPDGGSTAKRAASTKATATQVSRVADLDDMIIAQSPEAAMQMAMIELQGLPHGKMGASKTNADDTRVKGARVEVDDYLLGPLTTESYLDFRIRPLTECYGQNVVLLARRLRRSELAGYIACVFTAVLAILEFYEWVPLAIYIAITLRSVMQFPLLKGRVVAHNLAVRELKKLVLMWDALSSEERQSNAVKSQLVETTERVAMMVIEAQTTAASQQYASVVSSSRVTSVTSGKVVDEQRANERLDDG